MADKLYQVSCSPECGFQVRSHSKDEVKGMTKEHAKFAHKTDMADAEIEKMVKETTA